MSLTSWGLREMLVATVACLLMSAAIGMGASLLEMPWLRLLFIPLGLVLLWVFWFFRDPSRTIPAEPGLVVSPADGVVTHLDFADEPDFIGGNAARCSIFLSVFNVHLNRAPYSGKVEFLKFRKGSFFDARLEESLTKNQNQDMGIAGDDPELPSKALVRQSTGAIARNIVCPVEPGRVLSRGERYGMIKFGSRTTLFLSPDMEIEWKVKVGDKVKAGETVLAVSVVKQRGAPDRVGDTSAV